MTKQDAGGSVFSPQYQCHCFCYLFNLYLTRMVSWDWHIPVLKTPGRQTTTWQPRAAFDATNSSHLNPVNALMSLYCHSESHKPAAVEEFLRVWWWRSLVPSRSQQRGRRGCLPKRLPQVKTVSTSKTKPEPSLCIKLVSAEQKSGCHIP